MLTKISGPHPHWPARDGDWTGQKKSGDGTIDLTGSKSMILEIT